jgi:hypothetical protein
MAEADYRWESEALTAWTHGRPLPAQRSEETVMRACMTDASTALVAENEALKKRLAELSQEADRLRTEAQTDLVHLREAQDRMTDALGEAAKKPAPSAIATSTSSGTASTDEKSSPSPPPNVTVTTPVSVPVTPVVALPLPDAGTSLAVPPPATAPSEATPEIRGAAPELLIEPATPSSAPAALELHPEKGPSAPMCAPYAKHPQHGPKLNAKELCAGDQAVPVKKDPTSTPE